MDCSRMGYITCRADFPSETNNYHAPYYRLDQRDLEGSGGGGNDSDEQGARRISLDFLQDVDTAILKTWMPRMEEIEENDDDVVDDYYDYSEPADYDGDGNNLVTIREDGTTKIKTGPAIRTNQTVTPLPGTDPNPGDEFPRCCQPTWDCWYFMGHVRYAKYHGHVIIPDEDDYRKALCCLYDYWKPRDNCANGPLRELPDDWWEPPHCSEI